MKRPDLSGLRGPAAEHVPKEVLPCPTCFASNTVATVPLATGVEEVHCEGCRRLLRRRCALSAEQRAQELILRWAAGQLEHSMSTRHRRKSRGDRLEAVDEGLGNAVTALRQWARVLHKLPPLRESE